MIFHLFFFNNNNNYYYYKYNAAVLVFSRRFSVFLYQLLFDIEK